jgi:hypothetical protein
MTWKRKLWKSRLYGSIWFLYKSEDVILKYWKSFKKGKDDSANG